MTDTCVHTITAMDTVVTFQVVGHGATVVERVARDDAIARSVAWFQEVEAVCSRFDPNSELYCLSRHIGEPMPASPMLFEAVRFAIGVAAESNGAFDPTIGAIMERRGFDREHRTGKIVRTPIESPDTPSYRDVELDDDEQTITLHRPLLLDLGAVAKGLAIDMAARELQPFANFAIDAGGDLYFGGGNGADESWSVGIRHPRADGLLETFAVSDVAVCTSGDYERRTDAGHHLIDPSTDAPANELASVTVLAPSAMVADALATAAFVLGPADGVALLERHGVEGLFITPTLDRIATRSLRRSRPVATDVTRPT